MLPQLAKQLSPDILIEGSQTNKASMSTHPQPRNPFVAGNAVEPDRFYGRKQQWATIKECIRRCTSGETLQCISIEGFYRSGKSSMLKYIRERISEEFSAFKPIVVEFDLGDARFHTSEGITEGLRRGIKEATGKTPWSPARNADSWTAWEIHDGLQELRNSGYHLFVLFNGFHNIERLLKKDSTGWDRDLSAKIESGRFILITTTIQSIDNVYNRFGVNSPFGKTCTTELGAFSLEEWRALVYNGFTSTGKGVGEAEMALINDLAGGLPFYTQLAAELLWQHGDYSRTRDEFTLQAKPHFADLWRILTTEQQDTLRRAIYSQDLTQSTTALHLRKHGLIRPDGSLFSSVFAEFIQSEADD
jgi:hypothetical protein